MTKTIDTNRVRRKINSGYCYDKDVTIGLLCDEIDRLRGVQTPPQEKTVRAVAMVAVDPNANWCAYGRSSKGRTSHLSDANCALMGMSPFSKVYRLTATLPVPQEVEVVAEVYDG